MAKILATRSFLSEAETIEALKNFVNLDLTSSEIPRLREAFSRDLEAKLLKKLNQLGDFQQLEPICLGSWSRHELTPKSDIDLLFAGPPEPVAEFIRQAFKEGLKLRARTPADPEDWSKGVEPFDVLALHTATALNPKTEERLLLQKALPLTNRRAILTAIRKEREERRRRQDSITNYLEPNLKYGAGGLRDIEQAFALKRLYAPFFEELDPYPFQVLARIKDEFLYLRICLHLLNSGDILTAHDQLDLSQRFKMQSPQQLMTFVQSELERASFYADAVVSNLSTVKRKLPQPLTTAQSLTQVLAKLREDSSPLMQLQVRRSVNDWFQGLGPVEVGKALHKALYAEGKDSYLIALHRTRLLEAFLPDLKAIRGLVQHDHYHRFTADQHLVQTLREVQRAQSFPKTLGPLGKLTKELSNNDWWTLKLTALFHDLAKGRGGDHSTQGASLVDRYFKDWEYPEGLRADVNWLVQNHLLLSTAAFRQNPQAPSTWRRLFERGVEGRRLTLLALFTAIDIRATNPEAWTDWKARLLLTLVDNLRSPKAKSLQSHLKVARRGSTQSSKLEGWLLDLDPELLEVLSPKVLIADLESAAEAYSQGIDLKPKVIATKDRKKWVRFHKREDLSGTFLNYVKRLFGFGLSIQMSSVHTLDGIGVYDWFCLRTERSPRQIAQWLNLTSKTEIKVPHVEFQSIDLMAHDEDEWIFSFRGRDQRGLLLNAAQALHDENLSLRWARAHVWGGQVDDIFSVRPLSEVESTLNRLKARFVT